MVAATAGVMPDALSGVAMDGFTGLQVMCCGAIQVYPGYFVTTLLLPGRRLNRRQMYHQQAGCRPMGLAEAGAWILYARPVVDKE